MERAGRPVQQITGAMQPQVGKDPGVEEKLNEMFLVPAYHSQGMKPREEEGNGKSSLDEKVDDE